MSDGIVLDREDPSYFGAGPALLPTSVLQQAAGDLINYAGEGIGAGELSHRSKLAISIIQETKNNLKELLNVPDTHEIFFLQGGGTTGFSSIGYNLIANYAKRTNKKGKIAFAITGAWAQKSYQEVKRLGFETDIVFNPNKEKVDLIAPYSEWKPIDKENTAFLCICDNETISGVEFKDTPGEDYLPEGVELVADMSSNFLSKKIDVSKYGLIFAGGQKNVGLAGLTIYIIKKSLLDQPSDEELTALGIPVCPIAFHYPTVVAADSTYNTIPIFTCDILRLVTSKLIKDGGIEAIQRMNEKKADLLYSTLEKYPDFINLIAKKGSRSNMNVAFTMNDPKLEEKFLAEASAKKLTGLKGHRSVGGLRASIYNAVSYDSVKKLVDFIDEFVAANS